MNSSQRIRFLDGFRGLAILMVLLYHAFCRWPAVVPYGAKYEHFPLFEYGWLGVQLFFLISGFVILMTLEKCSNIKDFLIKRWLRLFPGMLIASLLIFGTAAFFYERPLGMPKVLDMIPGLTFIDPVYWSKLFGTEIGKLEGAFWSLFVEVKFYIIFGILYFTIGKKKAVHSLSIMFVLYLIIKYAALMTSIKLLSYLSIFVSLVSLQYYGWFAAGALLFLYFNKKDKMILANALFIGFLSVFAASVTENNPLYVFISATMVFLVFIGAFLFEPVKRVFEGRFLIFTGFISYPLYLIHENSMISMIVKTNKVLGFIPPVLLPVIPILILMGVSYIIAKYGEPMVKNGLKKVLIKEGKRSKALVYSAENR